MEICPVDRHWIHTYIIAPFLEGCERINQAWNGVDNSLEANSLSLTDRVILWIQGMALMVPLLNTIIWIAWCIFGSPEKYADSFCPEIESAQLPPPIPEIIIPIGEEVEEGEEIEQFGYTETVDKIPIRTSWVVEKFPDEIVATQNAREFSSYSVYEPGYTLKELHYQCGPKKIDLTRIRNSEIMVEIFNGPELITQKVIEIPRDHLPWIQQRAIGFKPFILSDANEMLFYAVIPEYPTLIGRAISRLALKAAPFIMKVKAIKKGQEEVAGFGQLLKVEIESTMGWPYNTVKSELWFDPETGSLKRFVDSGTFINQKVGELVQNNP